MGGSHDPAIHHAEGGGEVMNVERPFELDEDCDEIVDQDYGCPECGDGEEPDLWQSACWDDLCHGGDVPCMHGDYSKLPCGICGK